MSSREAARVAGAHSSEEQPLEPQSGFAAGGRISAWRFRLAVLRHQAIVYRVAYTLLRDRHDAEDATQEAFLRLWEHGSRVEHEREWLLAVVRNACLDRLRRSRRERGDAMQVHEAERDEHDPAWHAHHEELGARLRDRIAALPEPQRSLVVLFDVHGLDGAACARVLGLSTNQVKVYLHRARRRLRRELEESQ